MKFATILFLLVTSSMAIPKSEESTSATKTEKSEKSEKTEKDEKSEKKEDKKESSTSSAEDSKSSSAPAGDLEGESKGEPFAKCITEGTKNDPYLVPFGNMKKGDDIAKVSYCRTDAACSCPFNGPDSVYTNPGSTCDLSCNKFCFYSKKDGKIIESKKFSGKNAPPQYFNCGAETCDNVKNCS